MYFIVLCGVAVALIVLIAVLTYFLSDSKKKVKVDEDVPVREGQGRGANARRQRLQAARNARVRQNVAEDSDEEDGAAPTIELPEGKVGAKKLAKLQAKAEKKAQREVEDRERTERKKKQEQADIERQKQEANEKFEEQRRVEEERKIQEEKEKREYEEYLKMKEAFSVEEEGYEVNVEEGENLLKDFVNFIKENKVVVLEDLANRFKLKTQDIIDRIQDLQNDKLITGVVDDRGKFIYISKEELESVSKFVKQRGRVSIVELAENSNQLINMNPNTVSVGT